VSRRNRRGALAKSKRAARKGPPVVALGVSALSEQQLAILKEHGRTSPLLYRSLLWWLRTVFDEARAEGKDKGKEVVPTFWVLSGSEEEPSWRSGSHPNSIEALRAKALARKAGAPGAVMSTSKNAPDGAPGHALTLEHQAFLGIVEMHHWSDPHGWRVYDGVVKKTDNKVEVVWTPQAGEES
jgi:hypothetical protein